MRHSSIVIFINKPLLLIENMYDANEIEQEMLGFWSKNKTYEKAKQAKGKESYYFLDGPPYTSGKIHIGLAWNKILKDMVLRYKRMNGFDVWDRAGYDMHGLPTAHKVQEKFGIKHKDEIPKFGVAKFIEECKKLALTNLEKMNKDFIRLGIWMDFENAYKSVNNSFMEGEWWLVKKAHENKRLYEGEKTMHWCAHCATALAKHELEYKNVKDVSIFLKFPVVGKKNEFFIIWTTTPWTIPFNLAVMVHPDLDYIKAKVGNEIWILAKGLAPGLITAVADKKYKVVEEFKGKKLKGLKYIHPFYKILPIYKELEKKSKNIFTVVLSEEYVNLGSGSGLVHCAPGCGPEDYEVGHREKIPPFNNLSEAGVFPDNMGRFSGLTAKKDDQKFIDELKKDGSLIATTDIEHEYAHCWRCHKPVIFRTTRQWFFKVEDLKEQMRKLNKKVYWVPDWAGSRQFDSWLDNLRDNSITRQRYWGTPVPIWKCSKCKKYTVIGSVKELKKHAKKVPGDLHKPHIDEVEIKCSCGSTQKRIPDILDVWIDAGTTSWTCLDYPQEKKYFKKLYPPDFILEGKDQIRGWFNLLFVASMVSMKKPSYKSVYMHGFIQDAQGRKMSKSLGNIISPYEVIDKYGADTLRYYMTWGATPGTDINYNFDDVKIKHRYLAVLWNIHKFLIDLARTINKNPCKLDGKLMRNMFSVEEKYIISKLNSAIKKTTGLFERYYLNEVPGVIENLFLELSRTYIQLTREKASLGTEEDKEVVLYVIYKTFIEMLKLFAPVAPFITEKMYLNLKNAFGLKEESIHLFNWPRYNEKDINVELEKNIEIVKHITQSILSAREKTGFGVRWPLIEVVIETKDENNLKAIKELKEIIKKQTNIKEIDIVDRFEGTKLTAKADYKKLKPEFRDKSTMIIAKLAMDSPETIARHIEEDGFHAVHVNGEKFNIKKEHLIIERKAPSGFETAEIRHGFIYLNKKLTPELEAEGYARELTRRIQIMRKEVGLERRDKITLFIRTDTRLKDMLDRFHDLIRDKVNATICRISTLAPSKSHRFNKKARIKEFSFEAFFDKV